MRTMARPLTLSKSGHASNTMHTVESNEQLHVCKRTMISSVVPLIWNTFIISLDGHLSPSLNAHHMEQGRHQTRMHDVIIKITHACGINGTPD